MFTAHEATFGCEIETLVHTDSITANQLVVGAYHHGIQVPYLPLGWTAERDGSVGSSRPNWVGCEIVSPVLKGPEGIAQVVEVIRALNEKGHRVNATCGVHVHVGWDTSWDAKCLARLITIVAFFERGLYAITGTKSRERGRFCASVRQYGDDKRAKVVLDQERYHILNLRNLGYGRKSTVEFRAFSGSLDATKVVGWIQVCLGLVDRALNTKRSPGWTPKPMAASSGWKKSGVGQEDTERLIGYLAWAKSTSDKHGGKHFGWISEAIDCETVKRAFRRLAQKYDSEA
jgi:hypothetical protein